MLIVSIRGLLGQKKATTLTMIVLITSFMFVALCSIIASSIRCADQQQREQLYGRYQLLYAGNLDTAEAMHGTSSNAKKSILVGTEESGQAVGTITDDYQDIANLSITDGHIPQNEHEILLVGDAWGCSVGQEIQITYTYSYVLHDLDTVAEQTIRAYLLAGLNQDRGNYLEQIAFYWNSYIQTEAATQDVSPEMLHPLLDLTVEQQDEVFLLFASLLPEFQMASGSSRVSEPKEYKNFTTQLEITSGYTILQGTGFGEHMGSKFEVAPALSSVKLHATYTVSGIAEDYASHWDVNGLTMPSAFVTEENCQHIYSALEQIEADHPEVRPQVHEAVVLFYEPEDTTKSNLLSILDIYNKTRNAAYSLSGVAYENGAMVAYLTGIDPQTGAQVTYEVHGRGQSGYITINDERISFNLQELTDSGFRLKGLDPVPLVPVSLDGLYQNNTGSIRVNPLTYPPAGDPTQRVEFLLSSILIGISACSSFQLFLQSLQRKKKKTTILLAIGATDGQIVEIQIFEVMIILAFAMPLGCFAGLGAAQVVLPIFLHTKVFIEVKNLLIGILCNAVAILVGSMLPLYRIMLEYHKPPLCATRVLKPHTGARKSTVSTGYSTIWVRHCFANMKQTLLREIIVLMMAGAMLIPLFLSHRAYGEYNNKVRRPDRPDYELTLPYAASTRYLRELCEQTTVSSEKQQVYVTAENVLLSCDELLSSSPLLKVLRQDLRAGSVFEQLPEDGDLCVNVRIIGADWESSLVQRILNELPNTPDQEQFESGKSCIVLLPRYRAENGMPVLTQTSAASVASLQAERRVGALVDLSFLPQYAGIYGEDHSISKGDVLTLSGKTQALKGGDSPYLDEQIHTVRTTVDAVVYELAEGVWPISDTSGGGGVIILSGMQLVSKVYPKASTRMNAEQTKHFRIASKLYYPYCYGKTYIQVWNDDTADPSACEKEVLDYSTEFEFDVTKYAVENQKLYSFAQSASAMYLMMSFNLTLIMAILMVNLLNAEAEEDRKRISVLQTLGMTDGQYLGGQCMQMLLMDLTACLLLHVLPLIIACCGLGIAAGGIKTLYCQLYLLLQFYPWPIHALLCVLQLLILQFVQIHAGLRAIGIRK